MNHVGDEVELSSANLCSAPSAEATFARKILIVNAYIMLSPGTISNPRAKVNARFPQAHGRRIATELSGPEWRWATQTPGNKMSCWVAPSFHSYCRMTSEKPYCCYLVSWKPGVQVNLRARNEPFPLRLHRNGDRNPAAFS
jgi:hypothetical protein